MQKVRSILVMFWLASILVPQTVCHALSSSKFDSFGRFNPTNQKTLNPSHGSGNFLLSSTPAEEETKLRQKIKNNPDDSEGYNRLGIFLLEQNRTDDAIKIYQQVIDKSPYYSWTYFNLGNALLKQNRLDEAILNYRKVIELSSDYVPAYSALGQALIKANNLDEAVVTYKKIVKISPKDSESYYSLAKILTTQNKYKEAISAYRNYLRNEKCTDCAYTVLTRYKIGDLLYKSGEIEAALTEYYEVGKVDGGLSDSNYYLQLIERDPRNPFAHRNIARKLKKQKKFDDSEKFYRQALDVNFADKAQRFKTYMELGDVLTQNNKKDNALDIYYSALKIQNSISIYNYIQYIFSRYQEHEIDEVIKKFKGETDFRPQESSAHTILGMAFYQKSYYVGIVLVRGVERDAIKSYRKAIQESPGNTWASLALGQILTYHKQPDEAINVYQDAISKFTESSERSTLSWINLLLGEALYEKGNIGEALVKYNQALKLTPQYAHAHKRVGDALMKQGKPDEALVAYQKALDIYPKEPLYINTVNEAKRKILVRNNPELVIQDDRSYVPNTGDPLTSVLRSTVMIRRGGTHGTGWVVKRDGNTAWVVTNRHVVAGEQISNNEEIEVELYSSLDSSKRKRISTKVEKMTQFDEKIDLAVLKVVGLPDDVKPLKIKTGKVFLNQPLKVIGHAYNVGDWSSVSGEVVNIQESLLVINATTGAGNSGGPVIDAQNQVIGLIHGILTPTDSNPKSRETSLNPGIATAGVAQAYPIDIIIAKLRMWNIL